MKVGWVKLSTKSNQHYSTSNKRGLMWIIRFMEGKFPTKYLGAPLFLGRMTGCMFNSLVAKIHNKVAN